ncbi:MAG: hypothetical protein SHS37scaffold220_22 [Phage 67_12]|nr:MAG: hypothetical protein SHS37scaffold220_22 [Phage 67_12]
MSYGMPYTTRKPATQVWAIGEQVKVGFLSLRIVGGNARCWKLVNKDATKHYEFEPHLGLQSVSAR